MAERWGLVRKYKRDLEDMRLNEIENHKSSRVRWRQSEGSRMVGRAGVDRPQWSPLFRVMGCVMEELSSHDRLTAGLPVILTHLHEH